jgi:hypothetical protein
MKALYDQILPSVGYFVWIVSALCNIPALTRLLKRSSGFISLISRKERLLGK